MIVITSLDLVTVILDKDNPASINAAISATVEAPLISISTWVYPDTPVGAEVEPVASNHIS